MAVRDTNRRVTVTLTDAEYGKWGMFGTRQVSKEVMRRARAYDEMEKALWMAFTSDVYAIADDARRDAAILGVDLVGRFEKMADVRGDAYEGVARDVWLHVAADMAADLAKEVQRG